MIRSMTAFGSARAESAHGSVNIEFRSVNSRFLDVNFRIPEDLRAAEGLIRDLLGQHVRRGKVDVRVNFTRAAADAEMQLDEARLADMASRLEMARRFIPDTPAPTLAELSTAARGVDNGGMDGPAWMAMCQDAARQALAELQAAREREGQRLAQMMLDCAEVAGGIVDAVERDLPALLAEHQEKLAARLREALLAASPEGLSHISGEEISARIAQESSLFALRIDIAEELSRLRSHIAELRHLLGGGQAKGPAGKSTGSAGKRLDFLFQEMNREANTLGSKAGALSVTRAAIDLKLQIEQMREQAQNLE